MKGREWLQNLIGKVVENAVLAIAAYLVGGVLSGQQASTITKPSQVSVVLHQPIPLWWLVVAVVVGGTVTGLWLRFGTTKQVPGLTAFHNRFHDFNYELKTLDSEDLLLLFNDGKSWIPGHEEALRRRVIDRKQKLRVLLLHPASAFLPVLVEKEGRTLEEQVGYIKASYKIIQTLKNTHSHLVEIRAHNTFNPYVLHLTESEAVVHPFFLNKRGELPVFHYSRTEDKGGMYKEYKDDAEKMWVRSPQLTEADFTNVPVLNR